MKKVFSLLLALCMSVCMCIPSYATEVDEQEAQEVSEVFIKVCDLFFAGKGEAYSHDGSDITNFFYNSYKNAYSLGDYAAIKDGCVSCGVSRIRTHDKPAIQPRLEMSKPYEEMSYHLITHDSFPYKGKTWGFVVFAEGTIYYHDSTLQISSYTSPRISFMYDGLGAAFTGSVTGTSITGPSFINNRTAITFTVAATHEVAIPIPGVDLITGTIGPFSTRSVFEIGI